MQREAGLIKIFPEKVAFILKYLMLLNVDLFNVELDRSDPFWALHFFWMFHKKFVRQETFRKAHILKGPYSRG